MGTPPPSSFLREESRERPVVGTLLPAAAASASLTRLSRSLGLDHPTGLLPILGALLLMAAQAFPGAGPAPTPDSRGARSWSLRLRLFRKDVSPQLPRSARESLAGPPDRSKPVWKRSVTPQLSLDLTSYLHVLLMEAAQKESLRTQAEQNRHILDAVGK